MSELIDTTEMYLRILLELEEENIPLMRARIVERLGQSGPTVSQTVARMERDGLLNVTPDRRLEFTKEGRKLAIRVMRKHRLAERMLHDILGLRWELIHSEACRMEHVISDDLEKRIIELIDPPYLSTFGNPIPGLEEFGLASEREAKAVRLAAVPGLGEHRVRVLWFTEEIQAEKELLLQYRELGLVPGREVTINATVEKTKIGLKSIPERLAHECYVLVLS